MTVWRSRPYTDSGERETDDSFHGIVNAPSEVVPYSLPDSSRPGRWGRLVDAVSESRLGDEASFDADSLVRSSRDPFYCFPALAKGYCRRASIHEQAKPV